MVLTVSIDYFFMGQTEQEEVRRVLPMWAVKSGESRMTFSHVVERKGPEDSTIRHHVADLHRLGLRWLVFKSDQEPATLKQTVRESMPTIEIVMDGEPC